MYFTHSLAGAVTTKLVLDKNEGIFSKLEKDILWFVGITASVFPDFDLIIYFLNPNATSHRQWITHSVVLYAFASLILLSFGFFYKKKEKFGRQFYMSMALVFILGVVTHLILDYLVGGVTIFLPFNRFVYGYPIETHHGGNWITDYVSSWYMFIEGALAAGFLLILKSIKNTIGKLLPIFYVGISIFAASLISMFMV
ncbi:metal-dependent hydrolase [Patescibacteria group bacterium]|nr:metal-dependent hydrolase [Patescibacteria group bacterium]